ncbi:hypothetical protein L207DRAFT_122057 [Hyaloscypha variabilis F]|uniref:BHLH domain-containing protein n=1 Tax=Hyaloscypha variabilis (strain UAMH 11265 / GT02V1 / F) TaxID=1149755 RepID=A0A2J6R7S9_HYAVF|nr:hypothetical protein L207DRAFT_122057 [Hyaloscypha variabilis F]
MDSQLFDQFLEDRWSTEACESKLVDAKYNPLVLELDEMPILDDLESSNLFDPSSPTEFGLPSPISDASSFTPEDKFDPKSLISPWALPTTFDTATDSMLTAASNCLYGDNSPTISAPSLASSPASSSSDTEHDTEAPKPTTRPRKSRPSNPRSRSPIAKSPTAHNLIEKRYRNNLNTKINTLRDTLPSLRPAGGDADADSDCAEEQTAQKCSKGVILDTAIQYIAELERDVGRLSKENAALQGVMKQAIPNYFMVGRGKRGVYS